MTFYNRKALDLNDDRDLVTATDRAIEVASMHSSGSGHNCPVSTRTLMLIIKARGPLPLQKAVRAVYGARYRKTR